MTTAPAETGFIRVACQKCKNDDVWFKCNGCGKSDHFHVSDEAVHCDCGESYDRGNCTCGNEVPFADLQFVDGDAGPLALADLEVAWGRVAALVGVVVVLVGGVAWWGLS